MIKRALMALLVVFMVGCGDGPKSAIEIVQGNKVVYKLDNVARWKFVEENGKVRITFLSSKYGNAMVLAQFTLVENKNWFIRRKGVNSVN
jgi:hypothetical protein